MQAEFVDGDEALWPDRLEADAATGPLAGLRVLDLTAYAVGPWAASNLAQLGADVVRVDPPYGDPIRAVLPFKNGEPTTYMSTSLGKRSIVLDLKDPKDHALVVRLAAAADVVLENSRAGTFDRLGLGYEALSAVNPALVYCSSSSFGDAGPMASMGSTDPQGQAFSGFASLNGRAGGSPEVLRYVALVDLGTSMQLLNAVLIGLVSRRGTGRGQHLKTSQMEAAIGLLATRFAEFFASGETGVPLGSGTAAIVPSGAYQCADGVWVSVTAATAATWAALCRETGLHDDPVAALVTAAERVARRDAVDTALASALAGRPAAWWTRVLPRNGVPCVRMRTLDERPEELTPFADTGLVRTVRHPIRGTLRVAGPMWSFERTPPQLGDPELPGHHSEEILRLLTRPSTPAASVAVRPGSAGPARLGNSSVGDALEGLRVLDVTQGVAGPYCGLLLATLGADVVKVEPPEGDWLRSVAPPLVDGSSAAAHQLNRGKRSVVLDLVSTEGAAALRRLVSDSDILLHDMSVSTASERGLTPRELRKLNPGLVDCSVTAFGESGPWSALPATELEVQAVAGVWRYLGVVGEQPIRIGADVAGILGGCAAFQAVMAALAGNAVGQHVATSELAAITGANTVMLAALDDPDTWDGFHTNAATYPPDHGIATADGRIYYGQPLRSEEAWVAFCREIGADELLQRPEFATRQLRMPNQMALRRELQTFFKRIPTADLVEKVVRSDGIAVPIQDLREVTRHPQIDALHIVVPAGGTDTLAPPWRSPDSSLRPVTCAAPRVGADTAAVLRAHGLGPDGVALLAGASPANIPDPHLQGEAS